MRWRVAKPRDTKRKYARDRLSHGLKKKKEKKKKRIQA
jgi:hypothetical protein